MYKSTFLFFMLQLRGLMVYLDIKYNTYFDFYFVDLVVIFLSYKDAELLYIYIHFVYIYTCSIFFLNIIYNSTFFIYQILFFSEIHFQNPRVDMEERLVFLFVCLFNIFLILVLILYLLRN